MANAPDADSLRQRALDLLHGRRWAAGSPDEAEARELLPRLLKQREFDVLATLSERVLRDRPGDSAIRTLHVQALIETGSTTAAIDVARAGLEHLPSSHRDWSELHGLVGRAFKQIAIETPDPSGSTGARALAASVAAYAKPFEHDPANTWHAINLVAVVAFCRRLGLPAPAAFDPPTLAASIVRSITATPEDRRDKWDAATLAEASLALNDYEAVEHHLHVYLTDVRTQAFDVGSTLRQWTEVWGLERGGGGGGSGGDRERERGFLQILRTRLMQLPGADLRLSPAQALAQARQSEPSTDQLQAILGQDGTMSYRWWKTGLERALSVAAIYAGIGQRIGTGFLVSPSDFGLPAETGSLVLTNFHVVNPDGSGGALRPGDADIVFEAVDSGTRHSVAGIVWSSPQYLHDACLLRLASTPAEVKPIPMASNLPVPSAAGDAKVYIIGHPGGGDLEFSFQDNALLDHEDVSGAKPLTDGVCRIHYRTPTEKGSSGSPVFNAKKWQAVALHHAGGQLSRLNGQSGTYGANEGIALKSIVAAVRSSPAGRT